MKFKLPWQQIDQEGDREVEKYLEDLLVPVLPRPEFRDSLDRRLRNAQEAPVMRLLVPSSDRTKTAIWSVAGVLGGLLVLATGIRAVSRRASKKSEELPKEDRSPALSPAA